MSASRSLLMVSSVGLSIAVVVAVGRWLDWEGAYQRLAGAEPAWLAAALAAFLVNYWLRTWRFRWLLGAEAIPFFRLFGVTSLHGMFNYLMPAKSGELSYLFLVRRFLGIDLTQGAATLITARFFDFATLACVLPLATFAFHDRLPQWMIATALAFCALVGVAAVVVLRVLGGGGASSSLVAASGLDAKRCSRLAGAVRALLEGLRAIHRRRQYARLWIVTALIWCCIYANFYAIVASLGYGPKLLELVVVTMFLVPLSLVPVQGLVNLGTHEAAWIAALAVFGYPMSASLNIAVTSHVVLFALVVVAGALGGLGLATGAEAFGQGHRPASQPPSRGPV